METPVSYNINTGEICPPGGTLEIHTYYDAGEAMKYAIVAEAVAALQAELEKAFALKGVRFSNTISGIVTNYASALMYVYHLVPDGN